MTMVNKSLLKVKLTLNIEQLQKMLPLLIFLVNIKRRKNTNIHNDIATQNISEKDIQIIRILMHTIFVYIFML